jgi:hypothetical protein
MQMHAAVLAVLLLVPLAPKTAVGPPLVCHEFAIDDAKSLPWERGMNPRKDYDKSHLIADVAAILKTEPNLVVRMETLRRAALYTRGDRGLAWELFGRVGCGVLEQAAIQGMESLAWFDAGFLAACFDQMGVDLGIKSGVAEEQVGYGYLLRALEKARVEKSDQIATIEFAAALVVHPAMRHGEPSEADLERYGRHIDAAHAGALPGSLLAKNLAAHEERFDAAGASWGLERRKKGKG